MTHGALPNLIVIGGMKCGTSSLHEYLAKHPDVGMSDPKEVNFFSGENSRQSLDWYKALFDPAKCIRGESSQNYSKGHHPMYGGAPAAISKLVPDCKLIYLVRDPLERHLSHLSENYYGEPEHDKRWNEANDHYVKTGRYHEQLQHFLRFFPLSQILVVDSADLKSDRLVTMNGIFGFLGLSGIEDPAMFDFTVNDHASNIAPAWLQPNPAYRAARKLAPALTERIVGSDVMKRTVFAAGERKPLTPGERDRLAARFRDDVAALRALTGKPFASWQV